MAAIIDEYLDSTMDNDDVFPCKGCGEILEEGKAFELAGNRWHLDCFRCNTCSTLLDSDANLLLLGDGSLICNNCTYSCTSCGNKIEDLAILTGDQAFCSTCFRCRNCKRKIENLRYARTSQGIFCMGCHETLMARRRKKSKAAAAAKAREKEHSPMVKEKSLPALPPNAIPNGAFSNDRVDPESDTPTELSPRPRAAHMHNESSSRGSSRPARSPERQADSSKPEGLGLPAHAYRKNRNSTMVSSPDAGSDAGDSFFISVALDPSPGPTPRSTSDSVGDKKKDYFGAGAKPSTSEKRTESHSSTPHIAFQEKGRQHSSDVDVSQPKNPRKPSRAPSQQESIKPSPSLDGRSPQTGSSKPPAASGEFKLQEAPQTKKTMTSRSSSSQSSAAAHETSSKTSNSTERKEGMSSLPPSDSRQASETASIPRSSQDSRKPDEESLRTSIDAASKSSSRPDNARAIPRKELPPAAKNVNGKPGPPGRSSISDDAAPQVPPRSSASEQNLGAPNNYMKPRSAPEPPSGPGQTISKKPVGSKDGQQSPKVSPKLPRWSSGGDFSLDEDMARIMGNDEQANSLLRRVSNAVRHGRTTSIDSALPHRAHTRSASETTGATASPRWSKTPRADDYHGQHGDLASPGSLTPSEDPNMLKRQLRNSEQRVAELERQFNSEKDLKSLNMKLIEKRKTVSVLDTQTEIMIRQLEVLAGYVERAKETKTPVNPSDLEDSAIKEFVQKLDKVKIAMSDAIEQLHEERDLLVEEKTQAMADRDRALMEFEQLSSKNAQLADMNNDLTHQIQERYKNQVGGDIKSPNGLGIYAHNKSGNGSSINLDTASLSTGPTLIADEEPILESGPTVVQVRKGQVKKFNWKKGGKSIAQNVSKGMNRAVVAFQNDRQTPLAPHEGMSIGMPYNTTVAQVEAPTTPSGPNASNGPHGPHGQNRHQQRDPDRQPFGFFGKKATFPKSASAHNVSTPDVAEPPSVLFGSELAERAEYERRQIPNIVSRCIEEVELRGMDQEGIYRKTGGNSQVNMIKEGLDKSEDYDISDPDLDITAVTSVLKQYFRKLPTPLLTFEVYERILESSAVADDTERCNHLRKTFASMPQSHQDCLEFLMFHLDRVAQRQPENLMSPKNLAVVFAPTIMRDLSIEREMSDMHAKNLAIQFVIENSQTIFGEAA